MPFNEREKNPVRGNGWSDATLAKIASKRASQIISPDYFSAFMSKVTIDTETGCWVWMACRDSNGYGRVRFCGETRLAHRVSLSIHRKEHLCNFHVLHRCDNPPCVNPEHLLLGTNADNVADMVAKGRNVVLRGPQKFLAKLTLEDLRDVRLRLDAGETRRSIANIYDIHETQISRIATGNSYSGVK